MPVHDAPGSVFRHRLIRRVLGVRGELTFRIEVEPRFNYGRDPHAVVFHENGVVFRSEEMSLALETATPLALDQSGVTCEFTLAAGESATFVLRARAGGLRAASVLGGRDQGRLRPHDRVLAALALASRRYQGRWREIVHRSALTLKLLTYRATGGDRRGADDEPPRAARRRAQLGLPLHLDPRRGVLALRPAAARLHRRGRRVHGLARASASARPPPGASGPLQTHVRDRRPLGAHRRRCSTTSRATAAPRRSGSATAPRISSSSTSTAR